MPTPLPEIVRLLEQVKNDFDYVRRQRGSIDVLLVHRATNAQAEGVLGHPSSRNLQQVVAFGGAGHREPYQRFKDGEMQFRDDPVVDVKGNPIVDSSGRGIDFVMPAFRTTEFSGDGLLYQQINDLAQRAGRLVLALQSSPDLAILAGWRFSGPSDIWWFLVFEFAWARVHPLLVAEKRLWLPAETPNSFLPYDLEQIRGLASVGIGPKIPENWLKRLPEAYMSEIKNVAAASFDAADYLLNKLSASNTASVEPTPPPEGVVPNKHEPDATSKKPPEENKGADEMIQRRFKVALSFPGEHREVVEPVANALAQALGEPRVFYDKFHEEQLSRADLYLYLQNIYQNDSDLVVVFLCDEYDKKEWCGVEWLSLLDIIKTRTRIGDLMFLRLDDKPVRGMLSIYGYNDISRRDAQSIANLILRRWSANR